MSADLHVHSTASDGTVKPQQIVQQAHEIGLSAISLTDHDTIDGIQPAVQAASGIRGLEVIPGIEINTTWNKSEIHVLGYYIDVSSDELRNAIDYLKQAREERAREIIKKLGKMGIFLSFERILEFAPSGTIGRPHIAQAMVDAGYVPSIKEAFENYLDSGKPAYVPRYKIAPFRAIEVIKKAGGVPVLAHPGLVNNDDLVFDLIENGILGIEVYYPKHTQEMIRKYSLLCDEHGLIKTGGTDYHGPGMEYPPLGTVRVSIQTVAELKKLHHQVLKNSVLKKQEY